MGATTLLFAGSAGMLASHAAADTAPPWEVGAAKDVNEVGTLALYNSSGTQVTGGSVTDAPIAAYIVGSQADAHPKATAYMYTPKSGTAAGAWPGEQLTLSTSYPVTGAGVPSDVSSAQGPVVTGHNTDESIATYIDDVPNTDTTNSGYVNAYQLRVKTSTDGTYQALDFVVSNLTTSGGHVTGGNWTETYPGTGHAPASTSTSLSVSPSSVKKGKPVTLTATESAGAAHAAGKVQFKDNGQSLGSKVPVSTANGKAILKTSALAPGKNKITAVFTPTDTTSFASSTSPAKTVTVNKVALKNTGKPTLSGPHKVGKKEKVNHGSWSPHASKYSYQWYLGGSKIKHATKSSYKPVSQDRGKKISCKVTAKKSGYIAASAKTKGVRVK
jgi:hypothetical protein